MSRGVPTWQNVSAPKFNNAGMVAANKMFTDSLQGVGDAFTSAGQIGLDREDREIAEADRLFKREGDLLQRDLTNQEIAAGLVKAEQAPELFKSQQAVRESQINAANQRAATGAYNLGQSKKETARQNKFRANKAAWANQRLALGNEHLGKEDVANQFMDLYSKRGMSPEMLEFQNTLENTISSPTNAQAARTKQEEVLRKEAIKTTQSRLDNEAKTNQARIKAGAKAKSPLIKEDLVSNIKRTDLDKTGSIETDVDSQKLTNDYVFKALQQYKGKKINQAALDNLIKGSTRAAGLGTITGGDKDYFDSVIFKDLLSQYFQANN